MTLIIHLKQFAPVAPLAAYTTAAIYQLPHAKLINNIEKFNSKISFCGYRGDDTEGAWYLKNVSSSKY